MGQADVLLFLKRNPARFHSINEIVAKLDVSFGSVYTVLNNSRVFKEKTKDCYDEIMKEYAELKNDSRFTMVQGDNLFRMLLLKRIDELNKNLMRK